jgi:hypothetical protein
LIETIQFGKLISDFDPKAGFENLVSANNVKWVKGKYEAINELSALSDAAAGTPLNLFSVTDSGTGGMKNFVGTTTKIYREDAGTLTDLTNLGGAYNVTGAIWDFAVQGANLIMVNPDENPQRLSDISSGANFADLAGSPPTARTCAMYKNFLFLGNINDGTPRVNRLQRSALGDITDWTPSLTTGAGSQDLDLNGEQIVAIRTLGDSLYVYGDNTVWQVIFVGPPRQFQYRKAAENVSCISTQGVTQIDANTHIFMGIDDIYLNAGGSIRGLNAPIRNLIANNDPDEYHRITSAIDRDEKTVTWTLISNGAGDPDKILIYNYEDDRFTTGTQGLYCVGSIVTSGSTIDGLDNFASTIDTLPDIPIDDSFWNGGLPIAAAIATADSKVSSFTGTNYLAGTIKTGEADFNSITSLKEVEPIFELPTGTMTVKVHRRRRNNQATSSKSVSMGSSGKAKTNAIGRFVQVEFNTTGGHSGGRGFRFEAEPRAARG